MIKTPLGWIILLAVLVIIGSGCDLLLSSSDKGGSQTQVKGQLSSLSADGYALEPAFDPEVFDYGITVNYLIDEILIAAEALDEDDSVHFSKAQPMSLNVGNNAVTVLVEYEDGGGTSSGPDYTVTVDKEAMAFSSFLVEENFEGSFPPANWSIVRNSGDVDWLSSADTGYPNYTDGGTSWENLITYSTTRNDYVMLLLDDYAEETEVMFRFHYTSTSWNWFWQIDDVKIGEVAED